MTRDTFLPASLRPSARPLVGMVHLLPLPGSPAWGGSMDAVLERAVADATALAAGGVDGVLVENYGDVPFRPGAVEPWTVAALTRAVDAVRRAVGPGERRADEGAHPGTGTARTEGAGLPVGVNVLRNDAGAALGVAAATGADFIRVNVHTGTMFTDQGLLTGRADRTLRRRTALHAPVAIVADVHVKHAVPPPGSTVESAARDGWHRGLADVLVVTGGGTGHPTDPADVRRVKETVPEAPVWIGSGVTPETVKELLGVADGAIVGSWLHREGRAGRGVDRDRVARLVEALRG